MPTITEPPTPFRIMPGQATPAMAKQALMILANELRMVTYREPYNLGDPAHVASLLHTLKTELNQTIPLPDEPTGIFYLIVCKGQAALIAQQDVAAVAWGIAFALGGMPAAQRISWRPEQVTQRIKRR